MKKFTYSIILILNAVFAAGLLISYLAPVINPARLMVPALFGLAYPYLLVINLALVCYWLIRLRKEILVSLVVILAGWNHMNNLIPLNIRKQEIGEQAAYPRLFKILSYNVRGFDHYQWTHDPGTRNKILHFIEEQDPDIICFQEFFTSPKRGETRAEISAQLKRYPEMAVYYIGDPANRNGSGIATFSRFPIIRQSRIPFNSPSNAAMYTDMLVRDDTIRVFNIHLQSIRFYKENYAFMDTVRLKYSHEQVREIKSIGSRLKTAFALRAEQATMIAGYIRNSPYPVIVAGDFNDTPQSFAYRKIRRGLHDAFRKAGRGFGNTYAGEMPSFRIDYIIYSDPMIPYQCRRIKTDYSDHFPVTTWLYLPETTSAE